MVKHPLSTLRFWLYLDAEVLVLPPTFLRTLFLLANALRVVFL